MLMIVRALLALLVLSAVSGWVRADNAVWRLAGTFNGWNAQDPSWTMSPREGETNQFILDRRLSPGSYRFKFVRDGAWERGHFGSDAGSPTALAMPGDDIRLKVTTEAVYRIRLFTEQKRWSLATHEVDETSLDVRAVGAVVAGEPFLLDLSRTLTVKPFDRSRLVLSVEPEGSTIRTTDMRGLTFMVTPVAAGPVKIQVALGDGEATVRRTLELTAMEAAALRYSRAERPTEPIVTMFETQADGSRLAYINIGERTEYAGMQALVGQDEHVAMGKFTLEPGSYVVKVVDNEIVTRPEGSGHMLLEPGQWKRVSYKPTTPTDTVHLIGDFNGWARPGAANAIMMLPRPDGSFSAIINPPEGAHRYMFLLDGEIEVSDPRAVQTVPAPVGTPGSMASVMVVGPTPAEFPAARPNAIVERAVRHNPVSATDFTAISGKLGLVDVSLTTLPGDVESVMVNVQAVGADGQRQMRTIPMRAGSDLAGFERWSARVMTGWSSAVYSFTLKDGSAVYTTATTTAEIAPALEHPTWAMGAVWYQIFPERFRNGNPLNDPHGDGVYQMPWTADWYSISPEEDAAYRKRYDVAAGVPYPPRQGGDLFHVVWDRRYGGDLQGIAEKFDYLRDLGVTALYMNPIFEAESMHKYDATDFRHIDDNLATPASAGQVPEKYEFKGEPSDPASWKWSPADRYFVDEFLPAARKAGIRVVLDGVFNHTGRPFFAFRDIEEKGDKSPYKDWFYVTFDENGKLKDWVSWFNTGALPKFRQESNGDLVAPVKEHIFNITRRWMDPNGDGDPSDGIDGWRLDVALDVGLPFWKDWRALVKSINPDAIIIAEIWDDATPVLNDEAFDTQMHYPFCKPVLDWLGVRPETSTEQMALRLNQAFNDPPQTNLIHQNLFGSHDTDRYVSMLQNPGREYDQGNRPQDHDYPYNDTKPSAETYQLSLLGVAMQALYTGAPMVYYGDEVGVWGADDPTDRKPFPWEDLPGNSKMENPDERADWKLHAEYQRWLKLRGDSKIGPVLRFGATRHLDSGNADVFAFERSLNGVRVVAAVNRAERPYAASGLLPGNVKDAVVPARSARYWVID